MFSSTMAKTFLVSAEDLFPKCGKEGLFPGGAVMQNKRFWHAASMGRRPLTSKTEKMSCHGKDC